MDLKRRDFLGKAMSTALLASVPGSATQRSNSGKLDRLACNSWPFRGYFDAPHMHEYRDTKYPLLTQADFPEFLADNFKIHNVEFLPQHFTDTDPSTINKVKVGLAKANSHCCNLMGVEFSGGLFTPGADREAIAKEAERWIVVAVALGSPRITIALTGDGPVERTGDDSEPQVFLSRKQESLPRSSPLEQPKCSDLANLFVSTKGRKSLEF